MLPPLVNHKLRDDANGLSAGREHGIGSGTHQSGAACTVDKGMASLRHDGAELAGHVDIFVGHLSARGGIYCDIHFK